MSIAFCLSGGGAKGDFELGVLRLLYERGLRPNILTSTSVGSLNALKLAEGEAPGDPDRGLPGLEKIWGRLNENSDMYLEEAWLNDPDMAPEVRDVLTGRTKSLDIKAPTPRDGRWGDIDSALDLVNNISFLGGTGQLLLKSLNLIATTAVSLFDLKPIGDLLAISVKNDAIAGWAADGGKLRMATVALESGRLRYVSETGAVLERDGQPVLWSPDLRVACAVQLNAVNSAQAEIKQLQQELAQSDTAHRAAIAAQIHEAQAEYRKAHKELEACAAGQPQQTELTVDITRGALASASIPGIFRPVGLGNETYVDGGIRTIAPVQAALDLGASDVYVISASKTTPNPQPSFTSAHVGEIVERSVMDLLLDEIVHRDITAATRPTPASPAPANPPNVVVIAPDIEIHDMTTIDPGLIQINRDYGYMRAADVLDNVDHGTEEWQGPDKIAVVRFEIWRLENQATEHLDPTDLAAPMGPPPAGVQDTIKGKKNDLKQLIQDRRAQKRPMPADIDRWITATELHPWTRDFDNADFVSQDVPPSMVVNSKANVKLVLQNTGTTSWTVAEGYRLGSQAPQDNAVWAANRQSLAVNPVKPGDTAEFAFEIEASTVGGADFQWKMVKEGVAWFGASTPLVQIDRTEPAECADLRQKITAFTNQIKAQEDQIHQMDPHTDMPEILELKKLIKEETVDRAAAEAKKGQLGCA